MLARACAEAATTRARTRDEPEVYVLVNGASLGVVSEPVWELVRARLEALLGDEVELTVHDPDKSTDPPPSHGSGPRLRRRSVLIVEPDATWRAHLLQAFAAAGFDAAGVADRAQAVKQLAHAPPDVLVAEFELPRMAGDELLAHARASAHPPSVTVLIGAGLPQVLVPDTDDADLVVGQPFEPFDLVERVERTLRLARAGDAG
jgi:CheY-like chemotaxis protein